MNKALNFPVRRAEFLVNCKLSSTAGSEYGHLPTHTVEPNANSTSSELNNLHLTARDRKPVGLQSDKP